MKKFENDPNIARFLKFSEKIEPILLGLILLGFVSTVQNWPIPVFIFIAITSTLALIQVVRGLAKVVPSKDRMERIAGRIIHFAIALGLMAFLSQIQGWKGWVDMAMISMTGIMTSFFIFVVKKKSVTNYLSMYELSSLLLIMLYLGKVFYQMAP